MKNNDALRLRFQLIYFALYGTMACYYPFLPLYLEERNLSYAQMGVVFALNSLVGIIAQPIWGYATDKHLTKRKTLLISSIFCAILAFNFLIARSYAYILASVFLLVIFQSVTSPMCDACSYEAIDSTNAFSFGQVRFLGSVGFAVISLLLGRIIQKTGLSSSFIFYSIFYILTAYLVFGIRTTGKTVINRPSLKDVLNIIRQCRFLLFIFSVLLFNIGLGANSSYISVLVSETGGSTAIIGFVWFVVAMSEIPGFFFGGGLQKRFGELNLYIVAAALYALRFFLCSLEQSYVTVIAIQLFQGISYPLYLLGAMQYVYREVPQNLQASGITILASLGFGLGSFIGNLGGGMLVESYGIYFLYRVLSAACALSLLVGLGLKLTDKLTADN
ncbi:MAG: MFS transporter [Pseudomonadota bacterium]